MKLTASILLVLVLASQVRSDYTIEGPKKLLKNPQGYYRVLHGPNVAYKVPPYLPPIIDHYDAENSFSEEDAIRLRSWGTTVIRLTFYWEGVEPAKEQYNQTYIGNMKKIVEICDKHNIEVLLDLHQDAASKYYCGEGIPDWAVVRRPDFPAPLTHKMEYDEEGYPTIETCLKTVFPNYYFSYAVQELFQDFYSNKRGIRDNFANMWKQIVYAFKDSPNVIGYEIMNEPWVGNIYERPSRFFFGGDENLYTLYKHLHDIIREIDQKKIVMFENSFTDSMTHSLKKTPASDEWKNRLMHSYHLYCSTIGDPTSNLFCNAMHIFQDNSYEAMRRRWGVGGFLTEFGAISGAPGPGLDTMEYLVERVAKNFHSWAYWQYKFYKDFTTCARPSDEEGYVDVKGEIFVDKMRILARPYAHQICGEPLTTSWNEGVYEFKFKANAECARQTTHFYLSEELIFTEGFETEFEGCEGCSLEREEAQNWFVLDHSNVQRGREVVVRVTKK